MNTTLKRSAEHATTVTLLEKLTLGQLITLQNVIMRVVVRKAETELPQ